MKSNLNGAVKPFRGVIATDAARRADNSMSLQTWFAAGKTSNSACPRPCWLVSHAVLSRIVGVMPDANTYLWVGVGRCHIWEMHYFRNKPLPLPGPIGCIIE